MEKEHPIRRLIDLIDIDRKMAFDNLIYAHEIGMNLECLRDLSEYHGNLCMKYQTAMGIRFDYATNLRKSAQKNYVK